MADLHPLLPKREDKWDDSLFAAPSNEYRAAPFWAWNGPVDRETIREQVQYFKEMGMGGFHIHVRTGMTTRYLSDEYMELVRFAVREAKRHGMYAWLYDEDRWPSGSAGGLVTADDRFASRYLLLTTIPYGQYTGRIDWRPDECHGNDFRRMENGALLAEYDVELDSAGNLQRARRIGPDEQAHGARWYAYLERGAASAWMNNHPYVDTLNAEAIRAFRDITHARYEQAVGEEFSRTIPAIFTDEPQLSAFKSSLETPWSREDLFLPWTESLPGYVREHYGFDLLARLPELFWELPGKESSYVRYGYHDAVAELFASSYCDTLGDWCKDHGVRLTGHLFWEPTLDSQTKKLGEAMRCYRAFPSTPGIDMLCGGHEYNTAKQCRSALNQQGGEGMVSELYGAVGWDCDFRGFKLQGDWQAALGVTVRVPHLAWMTMRGEAKRDYPASIFYQSPWFRKFRVLEDHYARINTAMSRGRPVVHVGVIHPMESYWLCYGPLSQTGAERRRMDEQFASLTESLLFGLMDFDWICEARLPQLCRAGGAPLNVGEMRYRTIVVPDCLTLRSSTLQRLERFAAEGGRLIFLGGCPSYIDGKPSGAARSLYEKSERFSTNMAALVEGLGRERFLDATLRQIGNTMMKPRLNLPTVGTRMENLVHCLRQDDERLWIFIANGKDPESADVDPAYTVRFSFNGLYQAEEYDSLRGTHFRLATRQREGKTFLSRAWHMHDSLLMCLTPATKTEADAGVRAEGRPVCVPGRVAYSCDEPNMLLLDRAQYRMEGEPYAAETDILRADNQCRAKRGMPPRKKLVVQPYAAPQDGVKHAVRLRMEIDSEIEVLGAKLALEQARASRIWLNGEAVPSESDGWYVDRAIETVPLPALCQGRNTLEVESGIGARQGLEAMYLLGAFGVKVTGAEKRIVALPDTVAFGDLTQQGFAFYTGSFAYRFPAETQSGTLRIRTPIYRGGLIEVLVDGKPRGEIILSPYALTVCDLTAGEHEIVLKLYGTRFNGFGQLHFTPGIPFYPSPDSWRSDGDLWMDEYQLKPFGILKAPCVTEE